MPSLKKSSSASRTRSGSGVSSSPSYVSPTGRSNKLVDLHKLHRVVLELQQNAKDHIRVECESQELFDYLNGQVIALRDAFNTLSDVVMEEIDAAKLEMKTDINRVEEQLTKHIREFGSAKEEADLAKRTMETWATKQREWAKDTEILKVSHTQNAEWMQVIQRDVMQVRDQQSALKQECIAKSVQIDEEATSLRIQWHQNLERICNQLEEHEKAISRTQIELTNLGHQRMDDLDLLNRAFQTVQHQQQRCKSSMDASLESFNIDFRTHAKASENTDRELAAAKSEIAQLKKQLDDQNRATKMRLDSLEGWMMQYIQQGKG